jgi:1-acyl-sn-glycerol-3-phosphate acyltransferase
MLEKLGGIKIEFSGDKIPAGEGAIVFGNHVTNLDSVLIMGLLLRKGMGGSLKFLAKKSLSYTPLYGWSFKMAELGIFLSRNWDKDRENIEQVFKSIVQSETPCSMGIMPEGTRITLKKRAEAVKFCKEKNIEPFQQVLFPRPRGFRSVVQNLKGSHVRQVFDFTIAYVDGVIRLRDFALSSLYGKRVLVNVKRIPLSEVPSEDEPLQQWLLDRFRRKDKLLASAAATDKFEGEPIQNEPFQIRVITTGPSKKK